MQKINTAKIITLTYKLNTMNTLLARKNIVKIKKFKKLIIFKIITARNESNNIQFNSTQFDVKIEFESNYLNFESLILRRIEYK